MYLSLLTSFPSAVDSNGQPAFVSLVGANKQLTEDDVKRATEVMKSSSVLICDKGIPIEVGAAALKLGNDLGLTTIFNPAPKVKSIPPSVYPTIDVMVINADEGYSMTGFPVDCVESAKVVLSEFHKRGNPKVVLTLGKDGAVCSEKHSAEGNKREEQNRLVNFITIDHHFNCLYNNCGTMFQMNFEPLFSGKL